MSKKLSVQRTAVQGGSSRRKVACQIQVIAITHGKGGQSQLFTNQKRKPYRNKKILAAARGEECLGRLPCCNGNPATVSAAHSDYMEDGKGGSQKADDCFVAFLCSSCHAWFHNPQKEHGETVSTSEKRDRWHRAMKRTWRRLIDLGVKF